MLMFQCWIGSELLKHKLDRKQSISLANEHLDFSCREDETNSVYLKLELAKEMFLLHTDNLKKTFASTDAIPEISDKPSNHNDDADVGDAGGGVDFNQKDGEAGTINPDTSNDLEEQNKINPVLPSVSPASGQSVPANLVRFTYTRKIRRFAVYYMSFGFNYRYFSG